MTTVITEFDEASFNRLPSIEKVDRLRRESGALARATAVFAPIFTAYAMERSWALCVLHNHWTLQPSERPIQRASAGVVAREFATRPSRGDMSVGMWPSVLAVDLARLSLQ